MTHLCSHRHRRTQAHTDTHQFLESTAALRLCYTAVNTVSGCRCINYYSSQTTSGDPRSTGPLLSFITMPMAVPVTMVTCPPNTLTHQNCPHEDKMQGLVWLARAGLQNNLWSNQTHNQIREALALLNYWYFKQIFFTSQYVTGCGWLNYVIHRGASNVFPFPDDVNDVSVHQSARLCACGRASERL